MFEETPTRTTRSDLTGSKKRGRNVLAVRMLVARLAWLEAPLRWHEGRVVWHTPEALVAPGPKELSRAQRTLNRLAEYPHSAKAALGDPEAWRAACQARIELAKRLSALHAPDLEALVQPGRLRDTALLTRLTALLSAEALCRSGLPASPAAALVQAGAPAEPLVLALLADEAVPAAARALAALVLGALRRSLSSHAPNPLGREAPALLRRAYAWGQAHGLPPEPALALALLADEQGADLLSRFLQAQQSPSVFVLPTVLVREMLAEGESPARAVRLVEVAAETERLAQQLLRRPVLDPVVAELQAPVLTATNAESRREAAEALAEMFHAHAWQTRDPEALREIATWSETMLGLLPLIPALTNQMHGVLSATRALPPPTRAAFFRLLTDYHERLWPTSHFIASFHRRHPEREFNRLHSMLQQRWHTEVLPLLQLTRATGDVDSVREALELDLHGTLSGLEWASPELLRLTVELARSMESSGANYLWQCVHRLLHALPDVRACRRVVRALTPVLQACEPGQREWVLRDLIDSMWDHQKDLEAVFPRLIGFVPRYLAWQQTDTEDPCPRSALFEIARNLYLHAPARAEARLDWLLSLLTERARTHQRTYSDVAALEAGAELGLKLAGEDEARYRVFVRSAFEHGRMIDWSPICSAVDRLLRCPWLLPVIARLFPLQTGRCAHLLTYVVCASRFGEEILEPLRTRLPHALEQELPAKARADWRDLLQLLPDQEPNVRLYAHARLLQGESPSPPSGVVRAVSLPERLRRELAHLETRLAADPARADLRARAATLRARFLDSARLEAQVRAEVAERLEIAAAEAQLRLAEYLLDDCHRARLEFLAGPLPADLALTDDLRNAALLTVDIGANRKHLRRLLRHHLAGEHGWREAHPANATFLKELAERGVDAEAWLGEHPRTFARAGMPGGKVRLWLERDPLRILQMGNYFGTCLSLGNCNAFSTVTNASELNKRVIYAADDRGNVVGRKLIAVNAEGRLVGFRTYTACTDPKQNAHLARLFRQYAEAFARRCRLELDEKGEVPRLFVSDWYNDGIVPWNEDPDGPGNKKPR